MPSDVVFGEDFSWAQTSTIGYATDEATAGVSIATGISGMPGRCLQIDSGTTRYVGFPLPGAYSEGLLSVAGFIANAAYVERMLVALMSGSTIQIGIRLNADGSISALRNATVLPGGTSAGGVIPAAKRYRIEIGFVISDTVGEVKVNVDTGSGPVTVLNLTTVDTNESGGNVTRFRVYNQNATNVWYDDIWFDTDKTAFRADQTFFVKAITSEVSGVSTPSTGSDRAATIDEQPASATDYNTFATTGQDVFDCAALTVDPTTITLVAVIYVASKSDSGTLEFRSRIKSGSDYENGTTTGLNMTTLRYFDAYPTDPATTAAWATAGVNAAELVLERIS